MNTATLAPLLGIAHTDPERAVRLAALEAAARLPLGEDAWRALAAALLSAAQAAGRHAPERTAILVLAVRVPLLSTRRRLRSIAADADDPAAVAIGQALAEAGDPSQIERLLADAAAGQWHAFEGLAAMPLEQAGVPSSQLPGPPPPDEPQARFWYALAAARLGDWRWFDRFVGGEEPEPPIFFGPPSIPYSRIAALGPWPEALEAHVAAQLARTDDIADPARQRMARIIVSAVTGMTDADGMPIDDREARDVPPSRQEIDDAVGAARAFLSEATVARFESEGLAPAAGSAVQAVRIVTDAQAAAVTLPEDVPANQVIGNPLVHLLGLLPAGRDWPVSALVQAQLDAPRTALDDAQLAWVIARAAPARWIEQLSSMLVSPVRPIANRLRILQIAAHAAEHAAGRGPSPFRGSGGHDPNVAVPRRELIDDDLFPAAELLGAAPAADELSIRPRASESNPPQGDAAVFCPPVVSCGSVFLVQVFFYPPDRAAEARDQALEADAAAQRRGVMALPPDLPFGTRIDLHLEMPGLRIDEPDAVLVWSGRTTAAQFEAAVPSEAALGNTVGRVRLSVAGVPIGTLRFQLAVTAEAAAQSPRDASAEVRRYRRAFVSYSSQDRAEVLRRVQAFRIAGLEVFQDILDLEPGQRWERELYREIDRSDVFMLFWSSAAAASPWVAKEIDYALARKQGREDLPPHIAPVPIEGPPIPPPPERLRHLHFNDALLAHIAAAPAPPKS